MRSTTTTTLALAVTCLAPAAARAQPQEVAPGVAYTVLDVGIDVHVVFIARNLEGYELRVLGAEASPGKLYTRTVEELAEEAGAVVAINGYFFSGPKGNQHDQIVVPDSTLIIDGKEIRDCYTEDKVKCYEDKRVLGFAGGTQIRMFTSAEFQEPENEPYHDYAIGSDYPLVVDGACVPGKPYDHDSRTAVGYNDEFIIFMTTEPVSDLWSSGFDRQGMCELMIGAGAENAAMLDGGSAVGMVVNGVHVNPLSGLQKLKYGEQRHVANAIGLVKVAPKPPPKPGACPSGDGFYCGGALGLDPDTLYSCAGGKSTASEVCANGCMSAPAGQNDACAPEGGSCPNGDGLYCGESLGLTPGTLYSCTGGVHEQTMVCPEGCVDAGAGNNDYCSDAACECNSGACCDGCFIRPASAVCDPNAEVMYECLGGGCGGDIGAKSRARHCSGDSTACNGQVGDWSAQNLHADCSDSQTCSSGDSTCNEAPMCTSCTNSYAVTDYECQSFTSASGQGAGGGEIVEICGLVDAQGHVTVKARKYDDTTFSSRPYQVRVSPPGDAPCGPDTYIYKISDDQPQGLGSSELTFEFDSLWEQGQSEKGYCVTASTKPGDVGYDANSKQQQSWWYSDKFTLKRSCD